MKDGKLVNVVIPALNDELAIPRALSAMPAWVDRVIVVDNGSTDSTAQVAATGGAFVVHEPQRGYGASCLAGIAAIDHADVVVFLDADYSDDPALMGTLVEPIVAGKADLVIGSPALGKAEAGSLTLTQRFGNALACKLMRWNFGAGHTDLGSFRAVSLPALRRMHMTDRTYGWTVQMQVRAARLGLRVTEVPVSYRRRIGKSKISGTIRGVIGAGIKILGTIAVERWRHSFSASMDAARQRLLVFARFPLAGKTKTRLIPALGEEGAARLHAQMIRRSMHTATQLREIGVELHHDGGQGRDWDSLLRSPAHLEPQGEGDLGVRLSSAFERSFSRGDEAVIVIGTDCPFIKRRDLLTAFEQLRQHDMVIGPSADGGYYLLGLRRSARQVFQDISWGSEHVLAQTLAKAAEAGLSVAQLRTLRDIDTPDDLGAFAPPTPAGKPPRISVIIAARNEQDHIAAAIASARDRHDAEIIVVDGGSDDRTRDIAVAMGAQVLESPPGRAVQMNRGARAAIGDVLLFLHGDTALPPGYAVDVRAALRRPGVAAGAFRLVIDGSGRRFRMVEFMANLRSRLLGLPYGDQALFVRRDAFFSSGEFRRMPVMEDYEWIRRTRRRGKIALASSSVVTSARRWQQCGTLRLTIAHQKMILAYHLGICPERLARWR